MNASSYTQTEIARVQADNTIAVIHYETDRPGVLTIGPDEVADFLTTPVHTEEEAFTGSDPESVLIEDRVSGHFHMVARPEDGPASALDVTINVLRDEADRGELIGHIGVDSGTVMVGDPCYGSNEAPGALMEKIIASAQAGDAISTPRGDLLGIVVPTAYGDGVYPVFARRSADGRIAQLTVEVE